MSGKTRRGCPVKKNFYAEKEYRATQTIAQTILADSTLRQADATGLSADIICMSGGRVGHIAHMLQDAPNMKNMKDVIVVAGTNDISKEGESVEEFADMVRTAVGRFQDLAFSTHQALTFVEPPPQTVISSLATRKRDRLNILMQELSTKENCEFKYLRCPQGIQMDNGHHTKEGTEALLVHIHNSVHIIHNRKYITTDRLYTGVNTAYRYGCLNCLAHLDLDCYNLCPTCVKLRAPDPTLLTEQGDTEIVSPVEVHMSESDNKRLIADPTESTPSKMSKSNDGGHN